MMPKYPAADADGYRPAVEYCTVSLARKIIRDRRKAGLSQAELAWQARVRLISFLRVVELVGSG